MKRELAALSLLVVTGTLSFLGILYAVGFFGPSIEVEDTGGREITTSTSIATAPGEGWAALPDDHAVAAAIPRGDPPAPTTSTTMAPVLAPPVAEVRPSPDPAPPVVQGGDSIEALICSYGWDCTRATRIFRCESHLNPAAVGGAGERGIAQIHPVHRGWLGDQWDRLFDPVVNLAVAWDIYVAAGHSFRPWSCS